MKKCLLDLVLEGNQEAKKICSEMVTEEIDKQIVEELKELQNNKHDNRS